MKCTVFRIAAAALVAVSGAASAQVFGDTARVISATPIYERGAPQRECRSEQVTVNETRPESGAPGIGTVLGAIAGGVIGHQFGNSSGGRDRGTAAGAIVGGLIGNQIDRDQGNVGASRESVEVERVPTSREVQRCRTVQEVREVPMGYEVRYRYAGREFVTNMPYDPGRRVRVAVDIRPLEEGAPPPRRMDGGPASPRY